MNVMTHNKGDSDREIAPDDEHLKNPADIPTVPPKFIDKISSDNRRSQANLAVGAPLSSSTSTINVDDSTVAKPNLKAMLKCLALAIYFHVKDEKYSQNTQDKIPEIFDERIYPLSKDRQSKVNSRLIMNDHELSMFRRTRK